MERRRRARSRMSTDSFVHLHCHSHYSLLDGASPIGAWSTRPRSLGMNALALTDHGNLYGALEFYQKAKAAGINPIIGYEAYIAPGSRFHKEAARMKEASYHLTLLAQNRMGFQNLVKLASAAFLEGFYRKPRIDKELLAAHSEGLICLSGCVSGEFSRALLRGVNRRPGHRRSHADRRLVSTALRRPLLHRNPEQRTRNPADGDGGGGRRSPGAWDCRWWPPAMPITSTAKMPKPRTCCCASTPANFRTDTNRMRMEGDQFYLRSARAKCTRRSLG